MIARLLSAVFYIITRKPLGAFYVDQKKKGLLPSTLPSEHEQWGYATYNSNPNGQAIVPAISFNTFFAGFVTDTGIKWNTGGTFAGLSYENNALIFWPQYTGNPQTVSKNGTNYHWLIFCM